MDPNTARHVLRIDPFTPLTLAMVEASYAHEVWERHPSRYPDTEGRKAAEAWALTLAAARATLLGTVAGASAALSPTLPLPPAPRTADVPVASIPGSEAWPPPTLPQATDAAAGPSPYAAPQPALAPPRRRLSAGAVLGIVGGALALIAVISGIGFGAAALSQRLADAVQVPPGDVPAVEHYDFEETGFWFETALEVYHDGRLGECPAKFERGCWQMALLPETSCGLLNIQYSFSDAEYAAAEDTRSTNRTDVEAGDVVELVFGNDEYAYGWVSHVSCVEPPKSTTPS